MATLSLLRKSFHLGFTSSTYNRSTGVAYRNQEEIDKFVNLSCPISLIFNFKCYFILLIRIYDKIRLSLAAVCPSGPCKNCSLHNFPRVCPTISRKSVLNTVHVLCPKQGMYMYFIFFCPINRVRVSNAQRLTSTQILIGYPPPPPGGNVKCQLMESRNYDSSFSFLFIIVF